MNTVDIKALNERIQQESSFVDMISMEMNKVIVGQKHLVEGLMIGMLSNGHILLEGVPGRCYRYDDLFSEERRVCGKEGTDFCKLYSGG